MNETASEKDTQELHVFLEGSTEYRRYMASITQLESIEKASQKDLSDENVNVAHSPASQEYAKALSEHCNAMYDLVKILMTQPQANVNKAFIGFTRSLKNSIEYLINEQQPDVPQSVGRVNNREHHRSQKKRSSSKSMLDI